MTKNQKIIKISKFEFDVVIQINKALEDCCYDDYKVKSKINEREIWDHGVLFNLNIPPSFFPLSLHVALVYINTDVNLNMLVLSCKKMSRVRSHLPRVGPRPRHASPAYSARL